MRWTTKDLEENMSAPDLELVTSMYDLLILREAETLAYAVGKAFVGTKGKKDGRRRS